MTTLTTEDSRGGLYLTAPEEITAVIPGALYQSGHGYLEYWSDIIAQAPISVVVDLARNSAEPAGMPLDPNEGLYVHWPLHDDYEGPFRAPPWPALRALADFVGALVRAGHVVLVRCRGGRNRSSVVLATVLVRHFEYSPKEAARLVGEAREGTWTNERMLHWFLSMNRRIKEDENGIRSW